MSIANGSIFPRNGVPAGQAAPGADPTADATCNELFYKSSCNPRFDPQAMNSLISELVNVVNTNCDGTESGVQWDCDIQRNLVRAICRLSTEALYDCLPEEFPDIGDLCGDPQYLVLVNDGECSRIGTYSPTGTTGTYVGTFSDAQPQLPQGQTDLIIPDVFDDPTEFYRWNDLVSDDNDGAGTINETILQNSKISRVVFDLDCRQRLGSETQLVLENPDDVQEAYSQRMRVLFRYRTNGGPWVYNRIPATNRLATGLPINSLSSSGYVREENPRNYGPGHIEVETFYVGDGSTTNQIPLTKLKANTHPAGSGFVPYPRTTMRPSL